jgi:hypothetical protein
MKPTEYFRAVALVCAWALSFMAGLTFLTAYGNPDKVVLVSINAIGEANWELPIVLLGMTAGGYYITEAARPLKRRKGVTPAH